MYLTIQRHYYHVLSWTFPGIITKTNKQTNNYTCHLLHTNNRPRKLFTDWALPNIQGIGNLNTLTYRKGGKISPAHFVWLAFPWYKTRQDYEKRKLWPNCTCKNEGKFLIKVPTNWIHTYILKIYIIIIITHLIT